MPIYEYRCEDCQGEFELLVRGGEQPECESCGSPRLERLLSVPAAHTASSSLRVSDGPRAGPGPCGGGGCGRPECDF